MGIIESELPIDAVTNTHFKKLLIWHGVKKSEMGTKTQMKQKYKTIIESSKDAPVLYCKWTSADEDDITRLNIK